MSYTSLDTQIIWRIQGGKISAVLQPQHDKYAVFIVKAVNAHEKLLEAVNMVFAAADDGGGMTDIDWDMLRDAYNLGLKGEA